MLTITLKTLQQQTFKLQMDPELTVSGGSAGSRWGGSDRGEAGRKREELWEGRGDASAAQHAREGGTRTAG